MDRFDMLNATAAPLPDENIDTDIIFPARFLLIMDRDGLGCYAFHDRRYDADGAERPDFVLNRPEFRNAGVLIAGANFGCGSSREQAVWALLGFGIRCVIAPSFGEIFFANCCNNGVLPIVLPAETVAALDRVARAGAAFEIDLVETVISVPGIAPIPFKVEIDQRTALLNGWDETDMILHDDADAIDAFEAAQRAAQPWLYPQGNPA